MNKQDQEILQGAKENQNEVYMLGDVPYYATNKKQVRRSLADIREIVALRSEVEEKDKRIAELEDALNEINATLENVLFMNFKGTYIFNIPDSKKALANRDLEMQARGIEVAIDAGIDLGIIENDADLCEQLRNQAKGGE
jgi:hypothetical protein